MGDSMTRYASDLPDFDDLLAAAAQAKNLPAGIIEKDYYVVRVLKRLQEDLGGQFVLKGGTSLSKGWNLLERFSEDLDLLFRREDGASALSASELYRRMKNADKCAAACLALSQDQIRSTGDRSAPHRDSEFAYPRRHTPVSGMGGTIKLEMGARGGPNPSCPRPIRSFVTEHCEFTGNIGLADDLNSFDIECLDVTRTFVEKLFAVHAAFENNRALGRARHYYDLFQMAGLDSVREFLGTPDYAEVLRDVSEVSRRYWPDRPLPPGGSFRECGAIWPDEVATRQLELNYQRERELFFGRPPLLKNVLERLQILISETGI